MPRQSRIVLPNIPHHVTQRGNYRQKVFDKQSNLMQYCEWMKEYSAEYQLDILAYCLMDNHVHFIVVPRQENTLAKVFNTVHMRYAHYINRKRGLKGHLWQGRFYSCLLDDAHLYRAIRYVERNPVRANMIKNAWDYRWSSAKQHTGNSSEVLIRLSSKYDMMNQAQWNDYLKKEDEQLTQDIRLKTSRGLAVGSDAFIRGLEKKLKRSLKCLKQGRPRKEH